MSLRKFGNETTPVHVDPEDPQGLSRTALRHLQDGGDLPEEEGLEEAPEDAQGPSPEDR